MKDHMNQRVAILRDSVVKITQMLSGKGIEVTQRGMSAYVSADVNGRPLVVNLPYLPDNATEDLCLAIQGFLDHEVAHILFSDFTLISTAAKEGIQSFLNILEDARIEKCMAQRFTGSGNNLSVVGDFFLDKYTTPMMKEATLSGDKNAIIGVLLVPLLRGMSGQFIFKNYMKDKMDAVDDIHSKIADLAPAMEQLASTAECLEMARQIKKRLSTPTPPESQPEASKKKGGKTEKKEEKKAEEKGKNKSDEKEEGEAPADEKKDKGEPAKEKDKEEGADTAGEGEKKTEDEGGGEESDGSGDEEEGESYGESEYGDGEGDGDHEDKTAPLEITVKLGDDAAMLDAIDKENVNGFDEKMSVLISDAASKAAKSASYLVYTKEKDIVEPLKVGRGYEPTMFTRMADKVDHMVGPLQKDLERAVAARSLASWEPGKRSGRLHAANLSRLAIGDPRVFRKRHEATSKDVAVSLVVDASGSMQGSKIHLATQAAYALSSVLERIGIKHEVICFTTGEPAIDTRTMREEESKMGRRFSRIESLYMPILKGFNERSLSNVRERFGWLPNSSILANNVDGECIEIAARRLLGRTEVGKVMIVLSDGSPNAHGQHSDLDVHLRQVVKNVTAQGIKIVGIGIQSNSVKSYYPKHVVINNVDELPTRVIKELRSALVG